MRLRALIFDDDAAIRQTLWFRFIAAALFALLSYLLINFITKHLRLIAFWKKKKYIGSYEIDEQIGIGGMGIVYKAHSLMDKSKTYALKMMKEELLTDENQKKRFKNEAMLVDQLAHPNIVQVYERGEDKGNLYIVMELLEGQTLSQRYKEKKYPTVSQCIHIMFQLSHILTHIHKENIIHRDLKPENIMLISKDEDPDFVKLLDFGIARIQSFSRLTETGQVLGTISYLPPEVVSGGEITPAVDVYSLGILGYEMLTRMSPFPGTLPVEIMKKIIESSAPQPMELNREVPYRLNELIRRMMDKNPEKRPNTNEVMVILAEFDSGIQPHDTDKYGTIEPLI